MAETKPPAESSNAVLLQFVGLVLLLLAFFVLLNNISWRENARARAVVTSVVSSFDPKTRPGDARFAYTSDVGSAPGNERIEETLGEMLATHLPLGRIAETSAGQLYLVEVPLSSMWIADGVEPSPSGKRFLVRLGEFLGAPPAGGRYDLEVKLGLGPGMGYGPTDERDAAVLRVSRAAELIESSGAPRDAVASGVDAHRSRFLRLVLRIRPAGESAGSLVAP